MSLVVRPACALDDEFVAALAAEAGLRLEPEAERERTCALLLLAEEGQTPRGFILAWRVADEVEVLDVAVSPTARRRGVGRALVQELLARAHAEGARTGFLEVRASNKGAQALYRASGFVEEGRRCRYYSDGEDALLFRCCLAPGP